MKSASLLALALFALHATAQPNEAPIASGDLGNGRNVAQFALGADQVEANHASRALSSALCVTGRHTASAASGYALFAGGSGSSDSADCTQRGARCLVVRRTDRGLVIVGRLTP